MDKISDLFHFRLFDKDNDNLNRQAPKSSRISLEYQHIPDNTFLHAFELLFETNVGTETQKNHKLFFGRYLNQIFIDFHQKGWLLIIDGILE